MKLENIDIFEKLNRERTELLNVRNFLSKDPRFVEIESEYRTIIRDKRILSELYELCSQRIQELEQTIQEL